MPRTGIAYNPSFAKGPAIAELERLFFPAVIEIDLETRPLVFEFGGGYDYFFTKNIALITDFRILAMAIDTEWRAVGPGGTFIIPFESLDGFNAQALVGLRVFIG